MTQSCLFLMKNALFSDVSPKDCNDKCKGMKNRGDGVNDPENFYLTSHKKDFKGYPGQPSSFLRYGITA